MNHRGLIEGLRKLTEELSRSGDNTHHKRHINNFIINILKGSFHDEQITLKQILSELNKEVEENHDEEPSSKNR